MKNRHIAILPATPAMHPAQSWRDGYDDGANDKAYGATHMYVGDSDLLYSDGYCVGAVRRREAVCAVWGT